MSQVQSASHTCDSCRQPLAVCGGISYGSLDCGYRLLCNMLMSFEGWQFKLEIHDRSKEI